jgi:hypothetical protein
MQQIGSLSFWSAAKATLKPNPTYCAIAGYCGSCDQSDKQFADAVDVIDDHAPGWSSALFPDKAPRPNSTSADMQNAVRAAEQRRPLGGASATPATSKASVDGLFVSRSSERSP